MFTGLVAGMGAVAELREEPPGVRLIVDLGELANGIDVGASIAVNGCCLTVIGRDGAIVEFQAGTETLSRTNLGWLKVGGAVNIERSLRLGDELGGHLVTGHIDAVGRLDQRRDDAQWATFWFRVPAVLTRQMAGKGSVAVDGVSLTLVEVADDRFSVALIPHTLAVTTLGRLAVGDPVNIETDLLAKYVARQLAWLPGATT